MLRSTEQSSRELNEACPWNRLKSLEIVNMPTFADFFSFNSPDKRQFLFGQWEKTGKEFVIGFISLEQRSYLFVAPEFRVLPPNPQTGKAALPLQPMHGLAQASRFRCCVSDCNFLGWCNMMRRGHSASIVTPSLNWHPTHIQHHISHLFIILITISVYGYGYIYIYIYMIWYDMIWYDDMIYVYIYTYNYIHMYMYAKGSWASLLHMLERAAPMRSHCWCPKADFPALKAIAWKKSHTLWPMNSN